MFDLPVDVIRHIIKVSIEKEPLSLFDFDEEIFKKGEYTKDEIKELILNIIYENYKNKGKNLLTCSENYKLILDKKLFLDNIEILDSIENKNILSFKKKSKIIECSIRNNNLEILKFVFKKSRNINWNFICHGDACIYPVEFNNFEMLYWLTTQNPPCPITDYSLLIACKNNNLEITKYLCENCNQPALQLDCYKYAFLNKNIKMIECLELFNKKYEIIYKVCSYDYSQAIKGENLEYLKFLFKNHFPYDREDLKNSIHELGTNSKNEEIKLLINSNLNKIFIKGQTMRMWVFANLTLLAIICI
jgi:hypothetical protein